MLRVGQLGRQLWSPNLCQSVLGQWPHPKLLGMFGVSIKVLPITLEPLGRPQLLPTGGFVAGAAKTLWINKRLGHLHGVAEVLLPVLRQASTNPFQNAR